MGSWLAAVNDAGGWVVKSKVDVDEGDVFLCSLSPLLGWHGEFQGIPLGDSPKKGMPYLALTTPQIPS